EVVALAEVAPDQRRQLAGQGIFLGVATLRPADLNTAARQVEVVDQEPRDFHRPEPEAVHQAEQDDVAVFSPGDDRLTEATELVLGQIAGKGSWPLTRRSRRPTIV